MSIYEKGIKTITQLMDQFLNVKVQDLRRERRERIALSAPGAVTYWGTAVEKAQDALKEKMWF